MKTKIEWLKEMTFDVELNGHHFMIDADEKVGGKNRGPSPKPLLLSSLVGCTGMDVVSILEKMKVNDYNFYINAEADLTNEHPKVFSEIRVNYIFTGNDLPQNKILKAIDLSENRYCGVSAMLKKTCPIKYKVFINDKLIRGEA